MPCGTTGQASASSSIVWLRRERQQQQQRRAESLEIPNLAPVPGGEGRVIPPLGQNQKQHVQYTDATLDTRPVHESARLRHYARGRIESAAVAHGCCTTRLPPTSGHASRRDGGRVDRRLSKLLQHGVDLLEGRVDLLAKLAARQHHLVMVRARVSAARQHHLPAGCRLGFDWVAAGWSITRHAGLIGGLRRRAEAGRGGLQAGQAAGEARRAGPGGTGPVPTGGAPCPRRRSAALSWAAPAVRRLRHRAWGIVPGTQGRGRGVGPWG